MRTSTPLSVAAVITVVGLLAAVGGHAQPSLAGYTAFTPTPEQP